MPGSCVLIRHCTCNICCCCVVQGGQPSLMFCNCPLSTKDFEHQIWKMFLHTQMRGLRVLVWCNWCLNTKARRTELLLFCLAMTVRLYKPAWGLEDLARSFLNAAFHQSTSHACWLLSCWCLSYQLSTLHVFCSSQSRGFWKCTSFWPGLRGHPHIMHNASWWSPQ